MKTEVPCFVWTYPWTSIETRLLLSGCPDSRDFAKGAERCDGMLLVMCSGVLMWSVRNLLLSCMVMLFNKLAFSVDQALKVIPLLVLFAVLLMTAELL